MADKRYYWIKLKTDFFNENAIDFLLSQKNGCSYVVLYQMLCLKCANTNGLLHSEIGEMIIPYDVEKIVRDTKYFDFDTVTVALGLYKKLGLIYTAENNVLAISNYNEMVGSETSSAKRVREYRERKKEQKALQCNSDVTYDVAQENRYKSKDIRDKEKDKDKKNKKETKHKHGEYGHVLLTDKELEKLNNDFGSDIAYKCITYLDEAMEMKGYKYNSCYLAIRKWVVDAVKEKEAKNQSVNKPNNNGQKVYTLKDGTTTTNYFAYVLDMEES